MTHFLCQGYTFRGVRQPRKVTVGSSAPSWNLAHLKLLLMTSYGVNFMLGSWSFPTEPAMPFSGILPCREYFGATHEGYRQLRTPVTLMPFCRFVTVVMISYDAKFYDGVLILSTSPTLPFSSIITISWVAWRTCSRNKLIMNS